MTCSCCYLSPFHWYERASPSIFADDRKFVTAAASGKTASQIQSQAVDRYTERTGRSPGSIAGLSDRGDIHIEESNHRRAAK